MLYLRNLLLCSVALGVAVALSGCGGSPAKQDQRKPSGTESQSQEEPAAAPASGHEGHGDHAGHGDVQQENAATGLTELSDADRALAEKQKVCPVSGKPLDLNGKLVKITVKGQTVFLCCRACVAPVKKDPDKYLAKLKAGGTE